MLKKRKVWGPIPDPPHNFTWDILMKKALDCAQKASESGEIPVGALVITKTGEILSKAHNESILRNDPSAHAEIVALRKAAKIKKNYRLTDCYLVVTLEPCMMCTGAIREARLLGVVFGAYDERAGYICSCSEGLDAKNLGVNTWHLGGILQEKSVELLQIFFSTKRN